MSDAYVRSADLVDLALPIQLHLALHVSEAGSITQLLFPATPLEVQLVLTYLLTKVMLHHTPVLLVSVRRHLTNFAA